MASAEVAHEVVPEVGVTPVVPVEPPVVLVEPPVVPVEPPVVLVGVDPVVVVDEDDELPQAANPMATAATARTAEARRRA